MVLMGSKAQEHEVMERNRGCPFDLQWVNKVTVNAPAVSSRVKYLKSHRFLTNEHRVAWLLRAVTCIDLTTLSGDDTPYSVQRLCHKALNPIDKGILNALGMMDFDLKVAAVCVYPSRVQDCVKVFNQLALHVPVASVATGFPSGQYPLKTRLMEVEYAVDEGAKEVDIVINRTAALQGDWMTVYNEVKDMREKCGDAHLKTILATGELGSLTNVYKASLVCMMAGADFIKTSTGKETTNATLPVGLTMARAIRDYANRTGFKVGFKPAGGIRTAQDALHWQILMKEELGDDWLRPELFRIGASGLLGDIEKQLYNYVYGYYPSEWQLISA